MKFIKNLLLIFALLSILIVGGKLARELFSKQDFHTYDANAKEWFLNELNGVQFKTPYPLSNHNVTLPAESSEHILDYRSYSMNQDDLIVIMIFLDTKFTDYDLKVGLESGISRTVMSINGTNLNLQFPDVTDTVSTLTCKGTYMVGSKKQSVLGYSYWNGAGKFTSISTYGELNEINSIKQSRIIESIKVNF